LEKGDTALKIIKGNAIIFYGTTGSGKSTLTSGCSGRKLISIINEDDEIEIQIQD
jgi:ABC-type lipoprotein export system ATPase subunit